MAAAISLFVLPSATSVPICSSCGVSAGSERDSSTTSSTRMKQKGYAMGVLEWSWNAVQGPDGWHCPTGQYGEGGPLLIRTYTGTPTVMGGVFRNWIASSKP
jgi:hypothetical protein